MNKPSEQNVSSTDQTAPGKAPPAYRPNPPVTDPKDAARGTTHEVTPRDVTSKDAPAKTTNAAKGDDDIMSQAPGQPRKPS